MKTSQSSNVKLIAVADKFKEQAANPLALVSSAEEVVDFYRDQLKRKGLADDLSYTEPFYEAIRSIIARRKADPFMLQTQGVLLYGQGGFGKSKFVAEFFDSINRLNASKVFAKNEYADIAEAFNKEGIESIDIFAELRKFSMSQDKFDNLVNKECTTLIERKKSLNLPVNEGENVFTDNEWSIIIDRALAQFSPEEVPLIQKITRILDSLKDRASVVKELFETYTLTYMIFNCSVSTKGSDFSGGFDFSLMSRQYNKMLTYNFSRSIYSHNAVIFEEFGQAKASMGDLKFPLSDGYAIDPMGNAFKSKLWFAFACTNADLDALMADNEIEPVIAGRFEFQIKFASYGETELLSDLGRIYNTIMASSKYDKLYKDLAGWLLECAKQGAPTLIADKRQFFGPRTFTTELNNLYHNINDRVNKYKAINDSTVWSDALLALIKELGVDTVEATIDVDKKNSDFNKLIDEFVASIGTKAKVKSSIDTQKFYDVWTKTRTAHNIYEHGVNSSNAATKLDGIIRSGGSQANTITQYSFRSTTELYKFGSSLPEDQKAVFIKLIGRVKKLLISKGEVFTAISTALDKMNKDLSGAAATGLDDVL